MNPPATQIGPYIIERELGRGGMGVVYLARDDRLGRRVAIKSLSGELAGDTGLMARFDREARLLASMNHPNIAGVYGLEERDGARYLIMEYVEGRTLSESLRDGPLPIDEALAVMSGVAAGVEAAHEAGVIHRDLKPGNVIVTPAGLPKVLDFGLAKASFEEQATGRRPTAARASNPDDPTIGGGGAAHSAPTLARESPTLPVSAQRAEGNAQDRAISTIPGRVLGTAGYMSPEQARGRAVDRRTDVWALGCVLFECLTGKSPFAAATVSDSIAAIIEREPAWANLPANTPPRIRELLLRCLEKDPARRMRDAGDARLEIERALSGREWSASFIASQSAVTMPAQSRGRVSIGWVLAALILGALSAGALLLALRPAPREAQRPVTRLTLAMPPDLTCFGVTATRDGSAVVFYAQALVNGFPTPNTGRLYVRALDQTAPRPLPGTEQVFSFAASPDGLWVAYILGEGEVRSNTRLFKQRLDGSSPPSLLAAQPDERAMGSLVWLDTGEILSLSDGYPRKARVFDADSGKLLRDVELDTGPEISNLARPAGLPGGRFIVAEWWRYTGRAYSSSCVVADVLTGKIRQVIENGQCPRWSPTGHLVFARQDTLLAVRFDPDKGDVLGTPFTVGAGLLAEGSAWSSGSFTLSRTGTLVHQPGGITGKRRRVMSIKDGAEPAPVTEDRLPFEVGVVAVSPDGTRIATTVSNNAGIFEVWLWEQGQPRFQRLMADPKADNSPTFWTRDGKHLIAFRAGGDDGRDGAYRIDPETPGAPTLLAAVQAPYRVVTATDCTIDSSRLLAFGALETGTLDLLIYDLASQTAAPRVLVKGEPDAMGPRLSPDGSAIAFYTGTSGVIANFTPEGEISGRQNIDGPRTRLNWRRAEPPAIGAVVYLASEGRLMEAQVFRDPRLRVGAPKQIAQLPRSGLVQLLDVSADGRVYYIEAGPDEDPPTSYAVTLNFDQEILTKERAAASSSAIKQ